MNDIEPDEIDVKTEESNLFKILLNLVLTLVVIFIILFGGCVFIMTGGF